MLELEVVQVERRHRWIYFRGCKSTDFSDERRRQVEQAYGGRERSRVECKARSDKCRLVLRGRRPQAPSGIRLSRLLCKMNATLKAIHLKASLTSNASSSLVESVTAKRY